MGKRYRSGWWLEIKYWDEGLTQAQIAAECDVSPRTIRTYMKRFGIETREIEGRNHPLHGQSRDEATKEKISEALTGRELTRKWRRKIAESLSDRDLSEETKGRISDSLTGITRPEETRRRMSESTAGPANPNWEGGYSNYYGSGWSVARDRARTRDEVCKSCGHDGSERRLEVHHIIPVREFRQSSKADLETAHDLRNLVLLCNSCHTKADFGQIEFESGLDPPETPDE